MEREEKLGRWWWWEGRINSGDRASQREVIMPCPLP